MSAVLEAIGTRPRTISDGDGTASAWASEVSLIVEQLGVMSFRAAVVDVTRMVTLRAWSVGEMEHPTQTADGPLDIAFPGAAASLAELADVAGEVDGHTAVTRPDPCRCLFVWRKDMAQAIVAEARYRQAPTRVGEIDKALIRLLCQIGLGADQPPLPTVQAVPQAAARDRPAAARASARTARHRGHHSSHSHPGMVWAGRAMLALGALAAAWLLLVGLPAVHSQADILSAENLRLQAQADLAVASNLSEALASGESAALQAALTALAGRGLLEAAAVSNAKDRVVATHGTAPGLALGSLAVAPAGARGVDITQGARRVRRLWLISAPSEAAVPATARLVSATWLSVLAFALGLGLLTGQRWMRRHKL